MEYEKTMLVMLLEIYRKSKKSSGTNKINIATRLKPDKVYKKYYNLSGSFNEIEGVNDAAKKLKAMGFLTYEFEENTSAIKQICLNDAAIPDIETYLDVTYGIKPHGKQLDEYATLVERYKGEGRLAKYECKNIQDVISKGKVPTISTSKEERALQALSFIEKNKEPMYLKEASIQIFGNSHALDPGSREFEYVLEYVCRVIREADNKPQQYNEQLDDILADYGIKKEPETIRIKGPVRLIIAGKEVDISQFEDGIEFTARQPIDKIIIDAETFISVENKTSFNRINNSNAVIFYLGGYGNRFQKEFIRSVYRDNPGTKYYHTGDIDVNGFWIHHDLCRSTQVPFSLLYMGVSDLSNPTYKKCLLPLTENDKQRIEQLMAISEYAEVAAYMKKNNVKLEQEIISLDKNKEFGLGDAPNLQS